MFFTQQIGKLWIIFLKMVIFQFWMFFKIYVFPVFEIKMTIFIYFAVFLKQFRLLSKIPSKITYITSRFWCFLFSFKYPALEQCIKINQKLKNTYAILHNIVCNLIHSFEWHFRIFITDVKKFRNFNQQICENWNFYCFFFYFPPTHPNKSD